MTRVLVVHGRGADPTRRGLTMTAPGQPAALDNTCRRWGRRLGVEVATAWARDERGVIAELQRNAGTADALVVVADDATSVALGNIVAASGLPTVDLHLSDVPRHDGPRTRLAEAGARLLHGRGVDGYRWALGHLAAWTAHRPEVIAYGDDDEQVGELRLPETEPPHPTAVLVHGGFWYDAWERDLMDGLAVDLVRRGFATWNIEYRRVGSGGGWPTTAQDVAAAVDHLASLAAGARLDRDDVTLVGHSAGAQLILLAASRDGAAVRPRRVVSLAGVLDLASAHDEGIGGGAVAALFGDDVPQHLLTAASPLVQVPTGVPTTLAHLTDDRLVPVSQSRVYAEAAADAGEAVTLIERAGDDHFALIDPRSPDWRAVLPAFS